MPAVGTVLHHMHVADMKNTFPIPVAHCAQVVATSQLAKWLKQLPALRVLQLDGCQLRVCDCECSTAPPSTATSYLPEQPAGWVSYMCASAGFLRLASALLADR